MKSKGQNFRDDSRFRLLVAVSVWAVIIAALWQPFGSSEAASANTADPIAQMYKRSAPNFDLNLSRNLPNVRIATGEQLAALSNLKATLNAPNMTARWNDFGGSPDVMYDFASQPFSKSAAAADLQHFSANIPDAVANLLQTGIAALTAQAAPIANLEPQLGVYPTADGYRLVWKVAKFSTNPFGLYMISVDANTGEIVGRKDFVAYQNPVQPFTADIYPKYPRITQQLKDQGIISVCGSAPCDQVRVNLRKFDPSNVVTGLNGTLTGTNTVVNNALATKQPFAQAALGTWHFAKDDPTAFELRPAQMK